MLSRVGAAAQARPDTVRDVNMEAPTIDFGVLASSGQTPVSFNAGDVIFEQGSDQDVAYVVRSGSVEIRLGEKALEVVTPGVMFGEMALVDPAKRSATAVALEDVELVPINRRTFLFLFGEEPRFALKMLRLMVRRLRAMNP